MPSASPANPIYGFVYAAAGDKHLRVRMVCSNPIGQLTLYDLSARVFSVALLAAVMQSRRVNEFCLCPSTNTTSPRDSSKIRRAQNIHFDFFLGPLRRA